MTEIGTVASLHRFPVKSMQGDIPVSVDIDKNGIVGDRTWALRDSETGKLVSAKRPRLWRAMLDCAATGTGDDVIVTMPSSDQFHIHDPALPLALEALFGRTVSIEASTGPQQGTYESDWPEIEGISFAGELEFPTNIFGAGSTFVDVAELHLLTTTSMATIAAADPELAVDGARFRPSILLDTPALDGFPENEWAGKTMTIGAVELSLGDPTPRCIMTTVDQPGLPRQPGVLQTIAAKNRITTEGFTLACLGCYASVTTAGTVNVGDPITLRD